MQRGWRRPLDAYRASQAVPADRAGLSARLAAGFARVAALAEEANGRELLQRHAEERPEGASRSTRDGCACFETPAAQAPQHDAVVDGSAPSEDETVPLARLARAARRLARLYDRAGLARLPVPRRSFGGEPWEPVRLSTLPRGPRHHPRGEDVLAQARHAWEGTQATREVIAQGLGIGPATLTRWAQTGGWIRPDGAHSPIRRPRNPGFRTRMQQRIEARHRLGEAERMLEELEARRPGEPPGPGFGRPDDTFREATRGGDAGGPWVASSAAPPRDDGSAALEVAFDLLRGAAEIVGRPLPVERLLETPRARRGVRRSGR